MVEVCEGTVAYACVHRTVRYRGEDTKLYVVALVDTSVFVARVRPRLFDRLARPIQVQEIFPGTGVKVAYELQNGRKWMQGIQIVHCYEEGSPFSPVVDRAGDAAG